MRKPGFTEGLGPFFLTPNPPNQGWPLWVYGMSGAFFLSAESAERWGKPLEKPNPPNQGRSLWVSLRVL
jgi:hypothetical protein